MHTARPGVLIAAIFAASLPVQRATDPRAQLDAVTTIINVFQTHAVVALDDDHGDERCHAFRMALIHDLRFSQIVNDILVEFGNSRYQDTIDRFVAGGDVRDEDLRKVWQDTTMAHGVWDAPIYEDFFRGVRAINRTLPQSRRLRVLLGDPPIDWGAVHTQEDWRNTPGDRSRHPADVLQRESLAKGRRALVIYGALHLMRHNMRGPNLIEWVEKRAGIIAFVIISYPIASVEAIGVNPASLTPPAAVLTTGSSLENQLDAVLYLGPASGRKTSHLTRELCADAGYREMRTRRMMLAGNERAAEMLARECAAAQGKPDFSGVWKPIAVSGTPVPPPPATPGGPPPPPPPPKVVALTIVQSATEMKVNRQVELEGRREAVYALTYKLDGTESVNQMGSIVLRTTASWEDGALTLTSKAFAADNAVGEVKDVYRLENGDLVIETTRKIPAGTFTGRTVHRKQ